MSDKKPTPIVSLFGRTMTVDMTEISGFGGNYEAGCRAMVLAGVEWLATHPDAKPSWSNPRGLIGVDLDENDDCKAMEEAMLAAPLTIDGKNTTVNEYGATGAMMQFSKRHVMRAHRVGWDAYCKESREIAANGDVSHG